MRERVQEIFRLKNGATITIWRKTPKGKISAQVVFDRRLRRAEFALDGFDSWLDARRWAEEVATQGVPEAIEERE